MGLEENHGVADGLAEGSVPIGPGILRTPQASCVSAADRRQPLNADPLSGLGVGA